MSKLKTEPYNFLPFRFKRRSDHVLLVNDVGEYYFLNNADFDLFVKHKIGLGSEEFHDLKSKNFIYTNSLPEIIELLATKFRTKHQFIYDFTTLHMFVVTYRCNQRCTYCHAASVDEISDKSYDMDYTTAKKSVEIAFKTPSPNIKIEFQGGEPLLNFDIVKEIVKYAKELNIYAGKNLDFVICTNLLNLNYKHLEFFKSENIVISTSLDGSCDIHNTCRKLRNGLGSYDIVVSHLSWAIEVLGSEMVSALMTVTPYNIRKLREVVNEYLDKGLTSIFLRKLNPFGFAYENKALGYYNLNEFIEAYKDALGYIIDLNLQGIFFPEVFATILLERILTPFSTGFVDLQSPTGAGLSGVIYDVNGDVYISDEARMLNRTTGNKKFCIGNVNENLWHEIFCNQNFRKIIASSCIDAIPGCSWCAYKPYCGADPVRNYFSEGNMTGNMANNDFCHKHKAIFDILFDYLKKNDDDIQDVFWSWITRRRINEIRTFYREEDL